VEVAAAAVAAAVAVVAVVKGCCEGVGGGPLGVPRGLTDLRDGLPLTPWNVRCSLKVS
jgi:hypothetical protein